MIDHLRLSTSTADGSSRDKAVIPYYTKAARLQAENMTKRALAFEAWELTLDGFPSGGIEIPRPPISSMSSDVIITYLDSSGSCVTLASSAYSIDCDTEPALITPTYDEDWPDTYDVPNAVRVNYKAGYLWSGTVCATPEPVKQWIKLKAAAYFEHREAAVIGETFGMMRRDFLDGLLDPYVISLIESE